MSNNTSITSHPSKKLRQVVVNNKNEDEHPIETLPPIPSSSSNNNNNTITTTTPQPSSSSFTSLNLHPSLIDACQSLGWSSPTPIQELVIPIALQGKDVIALAETGSGKTGAFALPVLNRLLNNPKRLSVLVLSPTRELAVQIYDVFQSLGTSIGAKCVCVVGGVDLITQAIALAKRPHIVVATPGRLVDHLQNTKGFHLRDVNTLILDEADRMLSMDFEEEINKILDIIPKERITMLFSATMTSKVEKLQRASLRDGNNTQRVEVSKKYAVVEKLEQNFIFVPANARDRYLVWLLNEYAGRSAICFTATCSHAQRLAIMLKHLNIDAIPLHGQMAQDARLTSLHKFKSSPGKILVATDVASRGLDIPTVDLVVNYDVPNTSKDYIHRVGRTARAGRSGRATTIVSQYDVEVFQRIEISLGQKLPLLNVDSNLVQVFEDSVAEASRRANADLREMESGGNGKKQHHSHKGGNHHSHNNNNNTNNNSKGQQQQHHKEHNKNSSNKKFKGGW
jgi:ATP-dependent RNA helicase DDX47/RRP3